MMRAVVDQINATKGRVADIERHRPPADQLRGFDLVWHTAAPYAETATTGGVAWTPQHDITIQTITVVTPTALEWSIDISLSRVGIDSTAAGTHDIGALTSTLDLARPVVVTSGQIIYPYLSCTPNLTGAGVPITVIVRGWAGAEWRPSAGLPCESWEIASWS